MPLIEFRRHSRADLIGISLSVICMLHCLMLPVLLLMGLLGSQFNVESEWTHIIMLVFVVPISGIAFIGGWMRHKRVNVVALGTAGIALLAFAALYAHDALGQTADAALTTTGGLLLAIAHWRNRDCGCSSNLRRRPSVAT